MEKKNLKKFLQNKYGNQSCGPYSTLQLKKLSKSKSKVK